MSQQLFKLVKEKFSQVDEEWQWTYACLGKFVFNRRIIIKITLTDHPWRKKGREWMTKELVLNILKENLNGKNREPNKKYGDRKVFVEESVPYGDKDYLLVFWFEDNNSDWLWVRNCYPIS